MATAPDGVVQTRQTRGSMLKRPTSRLQNYIVYFTSISSWSLGCLNASLWVSMSVLSDLFHSSCPIRIGTTSSSITCTNCPFLWALLPFLGFSTVSSHPSLSRDDSISPYVSDFTTCYQDSFSSLPNALSSCSILDCGPLLFFFPVHDLEFVAAFPRSLMVPDRPV